MMNLTDLDIAVADALLLIGMVIFAYCFGKVYDWWHARKNAGCLNWKTSMPLYQV